MERDFAGSKLSQNDFDRLAAACSSDPKFPRTLTEWNRLVAEGVRQLAADAKTAPEFEIDATKFLFWSQRVGLMPGLDGLRAYLIIHRGPAINTVPSTRSAPGVQPKSSDEGGSSARVFGDFVASLFPLPTPAWG
jgi:hypothetical protein